MPISITYRTNGAWGAGKGSDLTPAEVDENFYNLAQAIQDLIDNPTPPNGIANIVQEGNVITFYLDNSDSFAVTLPSASPLQPFVEKSANAFTLNIDDRNTWMNCTHADGCVVSIPLDADSSIPLHAEFHFRQDGAWPITLDVPTDVTVHGIQGLLEGTDRIGAAFTLKHTDQEDVWIIIGLLADADVTATA